MQNGITMSHKTSLKCKSSCKCSTMYGSKLLRKLHSFLKCCVRIACCKKASTTETWLRSPHLTSPFHNSCSRPMFSCLAVVMIDIPVGLCICCKPAIVHGNIYARGWSKSLFGCRLRSLPGYNFSFTFIV